MNKKWFYGLLLFIGSLALVLAPGTSYAHTALIASTPADGSTVTEAPARIALTFNTPISGESRLTVATDAGEEAEVGELQIEGVNLTAVLGDNLVSGAYTATWTIVGEDGHEVEGSLAFTIEIPADAEPSPEENNSDGVNQSSEDEKKASAEEPEPEERSAAADEAGQPDPAAGANTAAAERSAEAESDGTADNPLASTYGMAGAVLVVLILVYFLLRSMMRRNRHDDR
ncbi:copper resistance protein CopC [Paenibacillus sp. IB182496]|uniref:Copper resistance protein CopC n=1 Tax=Paenibacillus sabuli TaxID=2772509 RepID=A0A927BYC1_9BACL|nr:copper resistance protein CopC [Paenibacillus sabuli]MBD2847744.1 copper resistance protein CopC [Paenibacillus sabuli]